MLRPTFETFQEMRNAALYIAHAGGGLPRTKKVFQRRLCVALAQDLGFHPCQFRNLVPRLDTHVVTQMGVVAGVAVEATPAGIARSGAGAKSRDESQIQDRHSK